MDKARQGIFAAAISPIDQNGRLNVGKLVAYCTHLLSDGGCDGVAPLGTTGEGTSIAFEDKLAVPRAFAQAGISSDQVIFGAGAAAVGDTIRLCKNTLAEGFTNVLVLPPYYYKGVSDEGLFAFYAQLIEGVGDDRFRVYLYHFPQMSATPLSPPLVKRLRTEFGPIVAGLKDSSGDFSQSQAFVDATGGVDAGFSVYPASEVMVLDAFEAGCAGIISGSTNVFGGLAQDARRAGNRDSDEYQKVCVARDFAAGLNLIPAMKMAEAIRSGDQDWANMLPPLMPLDDAGADKLRAGLAKLLPTWP